MDAVLPDVSQTPTEASDSDSFSSESSFSEEEEEKKKEKGPPVDVVLGTESFGGGKGVMCAPSFGGKGRRATLMEKKGKRASHFRRLRMVTPHKRPVATLESDDSGKPRKKRRGGVSEPAEVREADAKLLEPHPAVIFMREHTPVKPCGR